MLDTLAMLKQGGWIMFPLALCSLAALTIIIERALALQRAKVIDPRVLTMMDGYEGEESAGPAMVACRRAHGSFARLIEEVIKNRSLEHAQSIETLRPSSRRLARSLL